MRKKDVKMKRKLDNGQKKWKSKEKKNWKKERELFKTKRNQT